MIAEYKGDRVGQQLGPYRLTRLLGAGGFGEVYEADHRLLQQKRAIKLLLERHFHDHNQRERFLREARTLATLEHPNILPVLEVGEEGNVLYLVMPFYRRGTLNDLLKHRTVPVPLTEVKRLLEQMCAAVSYAHARHIAHLDLKPENMLLHEDGRLVLSDFGLAHLIKQGRLEAGSSATWGTPYYMAPEQIRGEPELRSDLYALGVILYQLLTNQRPFTGNAPEAVMMKHLLEPSPPLRALSPEVLATLEPVLHKALEKRPEDRYPTAEALLADFRAAVNSPAPPPSQAFASGVAPAVPTPSATGTGPVAPLTVPVSLNKMQAAAREIGRELSVGTLLLTLSGHPDVMSVVAWSPDGTRLATANSDRTVRLWDATSGQPIASPLGHPEGVYAVAWSPDATRLATINQLDVRLWDATSGQPLALIKHGVSTVAWSPNSMHLASDSADRTVCVWDAAGKLVLTLPPHGEPPARTMAWSPDGTRLAFANEMEAHLWDITSLQPLASPLPLGNRSSPPCHALAWFPNGPRLAFNGSDFPHRGSSVRLWDIARRQVLTTLKGDYNIVISLAWSPDGTRLATISIDQTVRLWDVASGQAHATLFGHPYSVDNVTWSPDGTRLALLSWPHVSDSAAHSNSQSSRSSSDSAVRVWWVGER